MHYCNYINLSQNENIGKKLYIFEKNKYLYMGTIRKVLLDYSKFKVLKITISFFDDREYETTNVEQNFFVS
jgi:hypothetical protein